jgi:hypothetical protein
MSVATDLDLLLRFRMIVAMTLSVPLFRGQEKNIFLLTFRATWHSPVNIS